MPHPGRIREEDIAAVRDRINIEDVIGRYVTLKKAGPSSLKGLCPFHDEKSPSFQVTPQRGYYHCLSADTLVLTSTGTVPISTLAGTTARVLTRDGNTTRWVDAPFTSYGQQRLWAITVIRGAHTKTLHATDEHRWYTLDTSENPPGTQPGPGTVRYTKDLLPGHVLTPADPTGNTTPWIVLNTQPTDRTEEVFCATVTGTHNFALADNILTGNCFGCGESGDVLTFVQKIEHIKFIEAIESLADQAGITLRYEGDGPTTTPEQRAAARSQRQRLLDAHTAAAAFYTTRLMAPDADAARRFLAERGFDATAATTFGCGYSPDSWEALCTHLRSKGFTNQDLLDSGLASDGRRGPVDRFRGRLMWPIRDLNGDIVGFGARKLHPHDDGPKYLNTPETVLYKKSRVLFGLDLARKDIARTQQVVVVEGYTDVMACHLSGITTAVATCGTAFAADHIQVLRRLLADDNSTGEVIFTFDGDAAGQKAALRAFDFDDKFQARTSVAIATEGMDPCDLRLTQGPEAVRALIDTRQPLFTFAVRTLLRRHDLTTAEGRVAALNQTAPVIGKIRNPALMDEYARMLAGWLGMPFDTVYQAARTSRTPNTTTPTVSSNQAHRREREVLKALLQLPLADLTALDLLTTSMFTNPHYQQIWQHIRQHLHTPDHETLVTTVLEHADPALHPTVHALAVEDVYTAANTTPSALSILLAFADRALTDANTHLTDALRAPDLTAEQELALLEQQTAVTAQRRALETRLRAARNTPGTQPGT